MKHKTLFGIAALIPGMFLMQASATSSVVVVDFDRAVSETPAGKDAISQLNALATEQRDAIQKQQKDVEDLQNRLRVQDRALSDSARNQLTKNLDDARNALEGLTNGAQQKIADLEQRVLVPVQQKTADAIRTYATEHDVKIVLDASTLRDGLIYVHDTADITSEIIRRIAANIENPPQEKDPVKRLVGRIINRPWASFAAPTGEPSSEKSLSSSLVH